MSNGDSLVNKIRNAVTDLGSLIPKAVEEATKVVEKVTEKSAEAPPATAKEKEAGKALGQGVKNERSLGEQALRMKLDADLSPPQAMSSEAFQKVADRVKNRISPSDRKGYERIDLANDKSESGTKGYMKSGLGTTAGVPASYGKNQMLSSNQVAKTKDLLKEPLLAPELKKAGITSETLQRMDQKGWAARSWYEVIASGENANKFAEKAGLSKQEAREIRELSKEGKYQEIIQKYGDKFAEKSGLPKDELRTMVLSRGLQSHQYVRQYNEEKGKLKESYKQEFDGLKGKYQQTFEELKKQHGPKKALEETIKQYPELGDLSKKFRGPDKLFSAGAYQQVIKNHQELHHLGKEDLNKMVKNEKKALDFLSGQGATGVIVSKHPELQELLKLNSGMENQLKMKSIGLYLEMPKRTGENLAGWYTRGAMTAGNDWKALEKGLPQIDIVTSRERSVENFEAAKKLAVRIPGFEQLGEAEQYRIIGQMARVRHVSIGAFNKLFAQKTFTSVDDYKNYIAHLPNNDAATSIRNWNKHYDSLQ